MVQALQHNILAFSLSLMWFVVISLFTAPICSVWLPLLWDFIWTSCCVTLQCHHTIRTASLTLHPGIQTSGPG